MKRKNKYIICVISLILISMSVLFICCLKRYIVIKCHDEIINVRIGIIDGHISTDYNNILKSNVDEKSEKKSHGDYVLESIMVMNNNIQLYYYDAEQNGCISSDSLLNGLSWMKDNGVEYVSISLSSKHESEELQKWIKDNSEQIKIYASYNNKANSLDFPAMYTGVVGVGITRTKDTDKVFESNKLIYLGKDKVLFCEGNSYLTPYAMLEDIRKNEEKIDE